MSKSQTKTFKILKITIITIFSIIFLIVTWIVLYFKLYYIDRFASLGNFDIDKKLVITLQSDDDKKYIFDLNKSKIKNFNWENYIKLIDNNCPTFYFSESIECYNPNNEKYYLYANRIYKNWKKINNYTYWDYSYFWTKDWKYLITVDWYTWEIFWFFPMHYAQNTIRIIELETWKSKFLKVYRKDKYMYNIDKIIWYIE